MKPLIFKQLHRCNHTESACGHYQETGNASMKTIIPFFALCMLLLLNSPFAAAQVDIQATLSKDIVSIKDGRYTAREFMRLKTRDETTFQV